MARAVARAVVRLVERLVARLVAQSAIQSVVQNWSLEEDGKGAPLSSTMPCYAALIQGHRQAGFAP